MKLYDLPVEILLNIFEAFDDQTLLHLACTCERLHEISRSILNQRLIAHLEHLTYEGSLCLDGLTVRNFLRQTSASAPWYPEIRLTLYHRPPIIRDLGALKMLLLRANNASIDVRLSLAPLESSEHHKSTVNESRWTNLLAEVMNIVAQSAKSQLTVARGPSWRTSGRPFRYEYSNPLLALVQPSSDSDSHISRTPRGLFPVLLALFLSWIGDFGAKLRPRSTAAQVDACSLKVERHPRKCGSSLQIPAASHLEQFYIHSTVLMELPFYHWTMTILQKSPITRLSFSEINLTHYDWEYILASLSIPTLTHFSPGSCNMAFPDLQKFISRHPSLTTLDLSRNVAIGPLKPLSSQRLLPNLNHLIANSEYLAHFLEPPWAFPSLLTITVTTGYVDVFRIIDNINETREFDVLLRCIARRPNNVTLILRFVSEEVMNGLNAWLRSHIEIGAEPKEVEKVPNILKLEVFVNIPPAPDTLDILVTFFPMFSALKHLALTGSFWDTKPDMEIFRRKLWETLPRLETLDREHRAPPLNSGQLNVYREPFTCLPCPPRTFKRSHS